MVYDPPTEHSTVSLIIIGQIQAANQIRARLLCAIFWVTKKINVDITRVFLEYPIMGMTRMCLTAAKDHGADDGDFF